jgi:hypothetical protein
MKVPQEIINIKESRLLFNQPELVEILIWRDHLLSLVYYCDCDLELELNSENTVLICQITINNNNKAFNPK